VVIKEELELEEEIKKQTAFAVIEGGGISGGDGDWLSKLNEGDIFLSTVKGSTFDLLEVIVVYKAHRAIRIETEGGKRHWVNPKAFCKEHDLFEILRRDNE
jgi:hypothetical protein